MRKPPILFADIVATKLEGLSHAERRVAGMFQESREEVLFASATALAEKAGTSDATVVRTVRALGFAGLDDLRRFLADEVKASLSQAGRLAATLADVGPDPASALGRTLGHHIEALTRLGRDVTPEAFQRAVELIARAKRVVAFGIGPSSAIAGYLQIQLSRFGLDAWACTRTGLLCADDLHHLRPGDGLVVFAYGRIYPELAALLDEAERMRLERILVTDTLGAELGERFDLVLPVARGRIDMLSMHTATLGLVEALLVGVATQRPDETLDSLRGLNRLRESLAGEPMDLRVAGRVRPPRRTRRRI